MTLQLDFERLRLARKAVCAELFAERTADGHWAGEISSSPLATAAAICALVLAHESDPSTDLLVDPQGPSGDNDLHQILRSDLSELIVQSLHWLAQHQNEDGGWGDATRGQSTLVATLYVQSAFRMTGVPAKYADLMDLADEYVEAQGGIASLAGVLENKYPTAPILATCALAGMVPWRQVPAVPFELACLPKPWAKRLRLPLDRLEVPTLIAIGQSKLHHDRPRNPINRMLRKSICQSSLAIVDQMQAADGSFAGSVTRTAMVVMGLSSVGQRRHRVVERGVEFLLSAMRPDASWSEVPDLSVSVTTAVINELTRGSSHPPQTAGGDLRGTPSADTAIPSDTILELKLPAPCGDDSPHLGGGEVEASQPALITRSCLRWLLACQKRSDDLASGAIAGGWGWNEGEGSVPNSASTAGAVRALASLAGLWPDSEREQLGTALRSGVLWLLAARNDDGGWPYWQEERQGTSLSAPDLTAQALEALALWQRVAGSFPSAGSHEAGRLSRDVAMAIHRGIAYLKETQRPDGSFTARQFKNAHHADRENPVLGTSSVLKACAELGQLNSAMAGRAIQWLLSAQHSGGGWGPPRAPRDYSGAYKNGAYAWRENDVLEKHATIEETSAAVGALLPLVERNPAVAQGVGEGLTWLAEALEQDRPQGGAVLGYSSGRIWYHERLYSIAFAAGALVRAERHLAAPRLIISSVG